MSERGVPLEFNDHEQAYRNASERLRTNSTNGKAETPEPPDSESSIPGWPEPLSPAALHGLAGDIANETMGEHSLVATDLIRALPEAIRRVRGAAKSISTRFFGC